MYTTLRRIRKMFGYWRSAQNPLIFETDMVSRGFLQDSATMVSRWLPNSAPQHEMNHGFLGGAGLCPSTARSQTEPQKDVKAYEVVISELVRRGGVQREPKRNTDHGRGGGGGDS